ncbi:MAG: hypothetical protein ACREV5_13295 [Steroidobacter sp.]
MKSAITIVIVAILTASACSSKNTRVFASEKEYVPPTATTPWKIGGVFDEEEYTVIISVNGENVLRGRFPPHTPRLTVEGKYDGKTLAAVCMFSSGIIGKSGWQAQLAEAIVSKATKTAGNTCEVKVGEQLAATLFF